jgi:hypothetical protein
MRPTFHSPEVAFWVDGAMPFRGETTKGYVTGLSLRFAQESCSRSLPYWQFCIVGALGSKIMGCGSVQLCGKIEQIRRERKALQMRLRLSGNSTPAPLGCDQG